MVSETLSLWGNGAVTLPKEWRDQFPTKHFMATETEEGLLIRPIVDVEYFEKNNGSFGLKFVTGMDAQKVHALLKEGKMSRKPGKKKLR